MLALVVNTLIGIQGSGIKVGGIDSASVGSGGSNTSSIRWPVEGKGISGHGKEAGGQNATGLQTAVAKWGEGSGREGGEGAAVQEMMGHTETWHLTA